MKALWAPWRMDYILDDKSGGCFLCGAAESDRDRDTLVIARRERSFAILNRYPYNNGHALIAPYTHTGEIEDLDNDTLAEIMRLTVDIKIALDREIGPHGYNTGLNLGCAAGAGLEEHLHMHIVPRWRNDTNFMPVLGETKVIPQHLAELWDLIAEK